uniref:hypothetical protein n=1 Tax=Actinoalloteichus cyanogriseus TaxID=2893586 RepID=UPI00138E4F69
VGALASLWVTGMPVDWAAYLAETNARLVDLPTYPFQRERYWPTAAVESPTKGGGTTSEEDVRFWEAVDRSDLSGLADGLDLDGDQPLREVLPKLTPELLTHPVVTGLAERGARVVPVSVGESGLDRAGFTRELGAVLAEHPEPAGILSLLGMSEDCLPELPEIPTGLITTL